MPSLIELYASHWVTQVPDLTGDEELMEAVQVNMEGLKHRRLRVAVENFGTQPEF